MANAACCCQLTMTVFYSSQVETVSQYEQYQDPRTGAAKWNSDIYYIINKQFIIYNLAFPAVTCQNIFMKRASRIETLELQDSGRIITLTFSSLA